jgi:nitroreductase
VQALYSRPQHRIDRPRGHSRIDYRTLALGRRTVCLRSTLTNYVTLYPVFVIIQRSPSSFNLQPTQIILVQDDAIKRQLADTAMLGAGNQYRTRDCSVLAVFLADLQASLRIQRIYQLEYQAKGVRHPNYLAMMPLTTSFFIGEGHAATLLKQVSTDLVSSLHTKLPMPEIEPVQTWAYKNTALAVQSYVLAATSHDLDTSIMEGLDGRRVREILRIPDRYGIPMVVATGYKYNDTETDGASSSTSAIPRLPLEEVVFTDTFGAPLQLSDDDAIVDMDDDVASNASA